MKRIILLFFLFIPLYLCAFEVHPGDKGIVVTEIEHGNLDTLHFIVKNSTGDNGSGFPSILISFTDSIAYKYGVASGMSGSPAYINRKLIGALSSTWPFLNKPLGNITPIEDMHHLKGKTSLQSNLKSSEIFVSCGSPQFVNFADSILKIRMLDVKTASYSDSVFPVTPGHAIGIALITGDMTAAIVGTITEKRGNEIFAFGHPALGLGKSKFPLVSCKTITTASSRYMSFKIPEIGKTVGAVMNDGYSGIYGLLGEKAPLIEANIHIDGNCYHYKLASSKYLSSLLFQLIAFHASSKSFLHSEKNSFRMDYEIGGKKYKIKSHMFGKREYAPFNIINKISSLMDLIYENENMNLEIDTINLFINSIDRNIFYELKRVGIVPEISRQTKLFNVNVTLSHFRENDSTFTFLLRHNRIKPGKYILSLMDRDAYVNFLQSYRIIDKDNVRDIVSTVNSLPEKPFVYYVIFSSEKAFIIKNMYFDKLPLDSPLLGQFNIKHVKRIVRIDSIPVNFVPVGSVSTSFFVEAK